MTLLALSVLEAAFAGMLFGGLTAFIATSEWYNPKLELWGKHPQVKVDTTTVRYDESGLLFCDTTFRV